MEKLKEQKLKEKPKSKATGQVLVVTSRFVRMAPDKIRFIGRLIIKKDLEKAISILEFSKNLARKPLLLVLKNALSQLKDRNIVSKMYIKTVIVDEGPKLKRRRIIHRGRATSILKRMSHIKIILSDNVNSKLERAKGEKNGS